MLSDEKISHLTHIIFKGLTERNIIRLKEEEGKIRREIKRSISGFLKVSAEIDEAVKRKLQSFSRKIIEGSPEWEVLYKKFYREETDKRGMASS